MNNIASNTEGVIDIHNISIHDYGTTKVITIHVNVNNNLLINQAHKIADCVEKKIRNETGFLSIIHIEPEREDIDLDFKKWLVEKILVKQKEIISFHKVNIIKLGEKYNVKMHLIVDKDMSVDQTHKFNHKIKRMIEKVCVNCEMDIHFEPCISNCKDCDIYCTEKK